MIKDKVKPEAHEPLTRSTNLFPVVGIGASAGGLDAFKKLLHAIPPNSGMAYVLVQHLDPNHESVLPELLQKVTNIPVSEITDDIKVEPNHIYIIPSNKILVANNGVLELSPRPATGKNVRNLPIDLFFASLAEVHQSHSIGVVLSGTASDGTAGLKAIKDHGGVTFAQDTKSAAYEGMPNSAVKAGVVDFILPPEKIPEKLLEVIKITTGNGSDENNISHKEANVFQQILSLLRIRKGPDFTYYKKTTIGRRILRRMALNKIEEPAAYLKYLRENKQELDVLFQDLLIPVTEFFRDHKVFDHLCKNIFPQLVKNKINGDPIRVWVAGCSTGEEAYSIAMCFKEILGDKNDKVQIFATDISEPAIAKARSGIYSKSDVESLSPQRLREFFTKSNGDFRINKSLRDMCVFAIHNFLKDPPFGKMDFISCRNVLIYMEPYLQKKALTTFHYALNTKGFLLLGKSETISSVANLYASVAKNDKLFSPKDVQGKFMLLASQRSEQNLQSTIDKSKEETNRTDFQKAADDILLSKYTPAGVVINEMFDIVHYRGKTYQYLEQLSGKPTHNLLKLAKDSLAFELRNILHKAKKDKASVSKENISFEHNNSLRNITTEAIPLNTIDPHYLILFNEVQDKPQKIKSTKTINGKTKKDDKDLRIQQLERELVQTHEDIRSITEEQEAANEELQSANEELLSSSEELQSLNEELETGKEELQSTNEELTVVNQELVSLNEQITAARDYAEAIIATLHNPMLILDKNLRIKSANEHFYEKFKVTEQETEGVLLYDLGNRQWDIPSLRKLLEEILPQKTEFTDCEIQHTFENIGECIMLLNARELKIRGSSEKLILLAIADVTQVRKQAIELQNKEKELLKKVITEREIDNTKLQQAVKERTKELEEKNIELQGMNKELEAFTYVSSHDLQEPLRKIQTFAKRILDKENINLSESGKKYFNIIQNAAQRMQILINDLLAFSRLSTVDRKFEYIDLNTIIKGVQEEFKEAIAGKNAVIEVKEICDVRVILFQFRQLMQNIIGNALKFSKPGFPPHIKISSVNIKYSENNNEKLPPNKEYCHISISDNGIGFEKEYSKVIFEVFQKLHGKEEYAGTGIGLAIVKKIVDNHSGFITATSEPDNGTTFNIYIPAA